MSNTLVGEIMNPERIRGESAYEIALRHGFVGTEAEWIASLQGTFTEDIYTNQDVGNIKGSEGRKLLARKGETVTAWVKKTFGEVSGSGSTPTPEPDDGGGSGGTETEKILMYYGSMMKTGLSALDAATITRFNKSTSKTVSSATFSAGYNAFVVAVLTDYASSLRVTENMFGTLVDLTSDFEFQKTVRVDGLDYKVYAYIVAENGTNSTFMITLQ